MYFGVKMNTQYSAATSAERIILKCRELYGKYGYRRFLMSKFEDYDLYAGNKSFLTSDAVLTFTDRSGKLKALKPDVTLSIVKNLGEDESLPVKVFYNENVYRPNDGGKEFSEIMQLGLESLGADDIYSTAEVIALAEMSLRNISDEHILDISHMGLISAVTDAAGMDASGKKALTDAICRRSTDGVKKLLGEGELTDNICKLLFEYQPLTDALPMIKAMLPECEAIAELEGICAILVSLGLDGRVFLDFSLINDMSYYNGIIFRGFVSGIPSAVLSGGRYDPLLQRFGRDIGACGFAIYLDKLASFEKQNDADIDVLLIYGENDDPAKVATKVGELINEGKRVLAAKSRPDGIKFSETVEFTEVNE